MNTPTIETDSGKAPSAEPAEVIAKLTRRVRRQPASLANYHYHLEPGTKVYVAHEYSDGFALVSTIPNKYRCSDDYFRVSRLALSDRSAQ